MIAKELQENSVAELNRRPLIELVREQLYIGACRKATGQLTQTHLLLQVPRK